jgi:hypothetical protein
MQKDLESSAAQLTNCSFQQLQILEGTAAENDAVQPGLAAKAAARRADRFGDGVV